MTYTGPVDGKPDRIVISVEDLNDSPPSYIQAPLPPMGGYPFSGQTQSTLPPIGPQPQAMPVAVSSSGDLISKLGANTVISGLLAGVIGGLLGFFLSETLRNPASTTARTPGGLQFDTGIWVALFAAVLGFVLMGWDGFTSKAWRKAGRDGAIGAGVGLVAGFLGGFIAQWVYYKLLGTNGIPDNNTYLLARTLGWGVFGGLLGTGLGIRGGQRKIVNGLIGGLIGGAVGGWLFQTITDGSTGTDGFEVRLIGLTLTGIGIGLAIGLVERVRRDSWIRISAGPMAGKEFILYNAQTRVGRDYRCDIVMVKDAAVAPFHATFTRDASGAVSVAPGAGAAIGVNGAPSGPRRLRNMDTVTIGGTSLLYQERAVPQ